MDIYIHREDRRYGPYTSGQLRQMLADGSVTREDLSSRGGDERIPVARLLEESPPPPPAPEIAVTAADLIPEPAPVKLWNPNHAASAAVLSFGILGPVIHAANWKDLGQEERLRGAWKWVKVFLATYVAIFLFAERLTDKDGVHYGTVILFGLLACWWFGAGKRQVKFIRKLPPGRVVYRSSTPLVFGSLVSVLGMFMIFFPGPGGRGSLLKWKAGNYSARAQRATEALVRMNLKSPSTARFSKFTVLDSSGPYFQTLVTVDSQNSFGAMVRGDVVTAFKLKDDKEFEYNRFLPVIFIEPNAFLGRGEFNMIQEEMIQNQKRGLKWPGMKSSDESEE